MILPFSLGTLPLPDWLPWWVPAAALVPLALYALLVLLVPFSTFGLKSRLADLEVQLDELRGDVRELSARLLPQDEPRPRAALSRGEGEPAPRPRLEPRAEARAGGQRAEPRLGPR